jgi:TetR/AcrR family transcriptional regulator, regulator of biofilm formation and stress response
VAQQAPRGEARRAHILEATLAVVSRDGPGAVTHRRVAAEAGVPLAATTYWFSSKDELLAEAYRLAAERDAERVAAMAAELCAADDVDLAGALTELLAADLAGGRSTLIAFYALWLEAARRPALRGVEDDWTAAYLDAVRAVLARGGSPTPDLDARVVVAAIDGLVLEQLAVDAPDPAAAVRPVVDRLVGALLRG